MKRLWLTGPRPLSARAGQDAGSLLKNSVKTQTYHYTLCLLYKVRFCHLSKWISAFLPR